MTAPARAVALLGGILDALDGACPAGPTAAAAAHWLVEAGLAVSAFEANRAPALPRDVLERHAAGVAVEIAELVEDGLLLHEGTTSRDILRHPRVAAYSGAKLRLLESGEVSSFG